MKADKPSEGIGKFWISGQPRRKFPGFFTFDREKGGHLRLDIQPDILTGLSTWAVGTHVDGPVIDGCMNGAISSAEHVQLRGCTVVLGLGAPTHVGFNHMLIGRHPFYKGSKPAKFRTARVSFTDLDQWAGPPSSADKEEREIVGFHSVRDKLVCKCGQLEIAMVRLEHDVWHIEMPIQKKRDATFYIQYKRPVPVEELLDVVSNLQYLVSLGMDRAVEPIDVDFGSGGRGVQVRSMCSIDADSAVDVRYPLLFRLDDIGISGVSQWLQVAAEYPKTIRHIWGFMYGSPHMLLADYLVNIQKAAEALATERPQGGGKVPPMFFSPALRKIYDATADVCGTSEPEDWKNLVDEANKARNHIAHIHEWDDEPKILSSQADMEAIHARTLVYLLQICKFDTEMVKRFYETYVGRRVSLVGEGGERRAKLGPPAGSRAQAQAKAHSAPSPKI